MEARIAEENLLAIHQKAVEKLHQQEDDRRASRIIVTDESSFW